MGKKSFAEMLELYLKDSGMYERSEPDFDKLRCYYSKDSHYKKTHDHPSIEKIRTYCYPCKCPHLRPIEKD